MAHTRKLPRKESQLVTPYFSVTAGKSCTMRKAASGRVKLAVPTCTAEAPASISSAASCQVLTPPMPTTGIFNDDALFALTEGLSVSVASISQAATFSPGTAALSPSAPATPVTPALPSTGSNDALILLLGGVLVAGAFAIRRVSRHLG